MNDRSKKIDTERRLNDNIRCTGVTVLIQY